MSVKNAEFSFKKGWGYLPSNKKKTVRDEIKTALNLKTNVAFYRRVNGEVEPKVSEKEAIETIFLNHGVKRAQIWGAEEE